MARRPAWPDDRGYFGDYGGRYVPETLMAPLRELTRAYDKLSRKRAFRRELAELLEHYAGRPTPLYFASRLTAEPDEAAYLAEEKETPHWTAASGDRFSHLYKTWSGRYRKGSDAPPTPQVDDPSGE